MKCSRCNANAQYQDPHSGENICLKHSRLQVRAQSRTNPARSWITRPAGPPDRERIAELAHYFWGETEVECFGHSYEVCDLPAFLACDGNETVGLVSFATQDDTLNLVMLNVLPGYQGQGAGRALVAAAEETARARGLRRAIVATSNDDLPALYFYQRCGYHLSGLKAGHLVIHHGGEETGFAGIPVRDELQLQKSL